MTVDIGIPTPKVGGPYIPMMLVLLFTDLEASTRLWEQHPEAMRPALARHDAILREAVVSNDGSVVKTTGDGLMATFSSVGDCLSACIEAQRTLGASPWETGEALRVRMGVNIGEAEARAGDFYGTAVNRAARIMAAGHGGQILMSSLAAQLAKDSLPSGATLRDLGSHRLKDLTQPENLFQLEHENLDADFAPLETLDARPHNLPVQVSEFFGRSAELDTARTLLVSGVRLLTLTGPGGTGKTRLAMQLAADCVGEYRDGVFLVDLSGERDVDSAFEAILRDVGIDSSRDGSSLQVLKSRLADRQMLIVLDNFEQVTDAAVGVSELVAQCPGIGMIVTSREALRIRGEHVLAVPVLGLPDPSASLAAIGDSDAVALFVDRARAAVADFALTAENASAVAEVTRRLDGLPLAIELAAARIRVFTAGELLERIRTHADALGSGARDLPTRQRTLRSTIEWSYELLGPDECRLFEMMSVFSTARMEAIEAVAEAVHGDIDTLEVLASLVDKSLIRSSEDDGVRRFSMLLTIRDYAAGRLAADPENAGTVQLAHALHFAAFVAAGSRSSTGSEAHLADMARELGNIRTAWQFWAAVVDLDQLRSMFDNVLVLLDARGWYQGVIDLTTDLLGALASAEESPENNEIEVIARASLGRALMTLRGYDSEADEQFRRVLEMSASVRSTARRLPILRSLATYHANLTDLATANAIGKQILELAEAANDESGMVEGHLVYGYSLGMLGHMAEGLDHLDQAMALFDAGRYRAGRFRGGASPGVVARNASALLLRQAGYPEQATGRATEAVVVARSLDHPFSLAYAFYHSGLSALQGGRLEDTRTYAADLSALAAEYGWPVWQALGSVLEGMVTVGTGGADEGLARIESGIDLYRGLRTPPVFWPGLVGLRAQAYVMAGRLTTGLELYDEALAAAGDGEGYYPHLRLWRTMCMASLPDRDPAEVEEGFRSAIRVAQGAVDRMSELVGMTQLVLLRRREGGLDESDGLAELYGTFTEGFDEPELVQAKSVLSAAG